MEADASQSHAGKKINSYSTEFKLEAVRFAVECNNNFEEVQRRPEENTRVASKPE